MKRALILLLIAVPAFALTKPQQPLPRGNRIAVLHISQEFERDVEQRVAAGVLHSLQKQLIARGFEAFDAKMTFEDAEKVSPFADYYLEIVAGSATIQPHGGGGVAIGPVAVDVGIVTSRVAAELRLYDARTMELIERFELSKRNTMVSPTAIGAGVPGLWASIALPLVSYAQYRYAAHAIAREAADLIASR